jgi:hypothetical protein
MKTYGAGTAYRYVTDMTYFRYSVWNNDYKREMEETFQRPNEVLDTPAVASGN